MSEEIKKSIEKIVDEALAATAAAQESKKEEQIEKGVPASLPANGGEDKMKHGSPYSEEEKAKEAKKAKAEEEDEEEHEEKEDGEEKEKMKKKMKKSEPTSELGELSEEEVELVKAWRAEKESEEITKSQPVSSEETLKKTIESALEPFQKALSERDALIKGLTEKVEKMASQPAYNKRSHDTLETIEKGGLGEKSETISKSQVLDKMLELQKDGKGVRSTHIAEFEATNNISNPLIKKLVMDSFKN